MRGYSLLLTLAACLSLAPCLSSADEPSEGDASNELVHLGHFLNEQAEELGFYYTLENEVLADAKSRQIELIGVFPPSSRARSVTDLVKQLDGKIQGVKVFQSPVEPSVIHFAYGSLLEKESYPLDRKASLQRYSGKLQALPDLLGKALDGQIRSPKTLAFPVSFLGDFVTDVEIHAEQERARDLLTRAAPLRGYSRLLWVSTYYHKESAAEVVYLGPKATREKTILREKGTAGYLEEMGRRLDCYFTIEDDMQEQFDQRASILGARTNGGFDFEIDSVEKLIPHLESILNPAGDDGTPRRVRAVRSAFDDRVVHLMQTSLSKGDYPLNEKADFEVWANLMVVPSLLGHRTKSAIALADTPRLPQVVGGAHPYVNGTYRDTPIREILTDLSPKDGQRRIIWASSRFVVEGKPKVYAAYYGVTEEVAQALGYDQGKPPASP